MRAVMSRFAPRTATALAVASIAFLATAPTARAATINYVFEPDTSITVPGYTETITGSFTFSTSTDAVSAVDITLSGSPSYFGAAPAPNPITFLYTYSPFNYLNRQFYFTYAADDLSSYFFVLVFGGGSPFYGLGGTSSPLVLYPELYNGPVGNLLAQSVSGGVEVAPTPLPAALPLFAGGLGVVGLFARRRKTQEHHCSHSRLTKTPDGSH